MNVTPRAYFGGSTLTQLTAAATEFGTRCRIRFRVFSRRETKNRNRTETMFRSRNGEKSHPSCGQQIRSFDGCGRFFWLLLIVAGTKQRLSGTKKGYVTATELHQKYVGPDLDHFGRVNPHKEPIYLKVELIWPALKI